MEINKCLEKENVIGTYHLYSLSDLVLVYRSCMFHPKLVKGPRKVMNYYVMVGPP